ncbi:MAG TPA: M12 family metallo-peptidase [Patescibacteria group bacterium]|nr:M12 family metallo-peptidase [Patescibacteria group bacterium]
MQKLFLSLATGVFLIAGSVKASDSPRVFQGKSFIEYGKALKDMPLNAERNRAFSIDEAIATNIFHSGVKSLEIRDFPVGISETKTVYLRPARPVADGETQWMVGTKDGMRPAKAPNIISYEGFVDGEKKSSIYLTYFKGDITGMVRRGDGQQFVVSPKLENTGKKHDHVLANSENVARDLGSNNWICGASDEVPDMEKMMKTGERALSSELLEVQVGVDVANTFARRFNNDYEKTAAYVTTLYGLVSRVYEEEINVVLHLNIVNIYDSPTTDPYNGLTSGHELLPKIKDHWNRSVNYPRHMAHLLAGPPPSNGSSQVVAGVAYLRTLCRPSEAYGVNLVFNYNVGLPALGYVSEVKLIAHETGHIFGSPHTHKYGSEGINGYDPPIDSCVSNRPGPYVTPDAASNGEPRAPSNGIGTIMSYCNLQFSHLEQLTFGPRPQAVIRAGAESARAGSQICLAPPKNPAVYMQYPVGRQNLIAGAEDEIRWTSARINMVRVQYSTDNGTSWVTVEDNIAATERKIRWTVPKLSSTTFLVRVSDVTNPSVYDQTEASMSIAMPVLSLTYPTGGERLGHGEIVDIKWNSQLVPVINIDYSPTGQAPWIWVAENLRSSLYKWTVPANETSTAIIRVSDTSGRIISSSQPFSLGTSAGTLISPNGGEKWGRGARVWIAWNSDFVSRITLEYSVDGGQTWKAVRRPNIPLDASLGAFQWTVPEDVSTNALMRIVNAATDQELDKSDAPFELDLVSSVDDAVAESNGLAISGITPNPARDEAVVTLSANELAGSGMTTLEIVDVTGKVLFTTTYSSQGATGERAIRLNLSEVPQGVYLLVIKSGTAQVSAPLRIVR